MFFFFATNVYGNTRYPKNGIPDQTDGIYTLFQTKTAKSIPYFKLGMLENDTLWGGTYLYGLCMGVPTPPPSRRILKSCRWLFLVPWVTFAFAARQQKLLLSPAYSDFQGLRSEEVSVISRDRGFRCAAEFWRFRSARWIWWRARFRNWMRRHKQLSRRGDQNFNCSTWKVRRLTPAFKTWTRFGRWTLNSKKFVHRAHNQGTHCFRSAELPERDSERKEKQTAKCTRSDSARLPQTCAKAQNSSQRW